MAPVFNTNKSPKPIMKKRLSQMKSISFPSVQSDTTTGISYGPIFRLISQPLKRILTLKNKVDISYTYRMQHSGIYMLNQLYKSAANNIYLTQRKNMIMLLIRVSHQEKAVQKSLFNM